jgi:hypothetical protein
MPAPPSDALLRPVLIECRRTGRLVRAGLDVADPREIPARNVLKACEACGENHTWQAFEATVAIGPAA